MSEITPNEEFIKNNYDKTVHLIRKAYKVENEKGCPPLLKMVQDLGERYAMCPASSRREYYSAFPGGLCYHNLNVLRWFMQFANLMFPGKYSGETILKLSILHNVGKIGDMSHDLYLPTNEEWKTKNGTYYDINKEIPYMRIPQRSLYLANQFGVPLTQEEYTAIMLSEGQYDEANSSYKYREPKLALILQNASHWATALEKDNKINWL